MCADFTACPDPLARAPRAGGRASVLIAPPSLQGAFSASPAVSRHTTALSAPCRLGWR